MKIYTLIFKPQNINILLKNDTNTLKVLSNIHPKLNELDKKIVDVLFKLKKLKKKKKK